MRDQNHKIIQDDIVLWPFAGGRDAEARKLMKIFARGKFSSVRFSKERAAGNYWVLWEKGTGREKGIREREERETGGQRDRERGGRRRTRIRPLRGRQQAPAGGNGVKCSGNNEVFRCPTRLNPQLARPPAASVIPLFRRYNSRLHRHETRPPYIFRIWNKCTGRRTEGGGLQDGVPPPSLITYSRPSRASRPRGGYPLRRSATLRLLGRICDSPPLTYLLSAFRATH